MTANSLYICPFIVSVPLMSPHADSTWTMEVPGGGQGRVNICSGAHTRGDALPAHESIKPLKRLP